MFSPFDKHGCRLLDKDQKDYKEIRRNIEWQRGNTSAWQSCRTYKRRLLLQKKKGLDVYIYMFAYIQNSEKVLITNYKLWNKQVPDFLSVYNIGKKLNMK